MSITRDHWNGVYTTKGETEVSWYQLHPEPSLTYIKSAAPNPSASVLDVGGGTSTLVDELLDQGYSDLTVLDVSESALARSKARLGLQASKISWIVADITTWRPQRTWQVWHDRAVFHFLTALADQDAYISSLTRATVPGSKVVISCFALDGTERCSGLPVQRYSPAMLAARIGGDFKLVSESSEQHVTPWQSVQKFMYAVLERG